MYTYGEIRVTLEEVIGLQRSETLDGRSILSEYNRGALGPCRDESFET